MARDIMSGEDEAVKTFIVSQCSDKWHVAFQARTSDEKLEQDMDHIFAATISMKSSI